MRTLIATRGRALIALLALALTAASVPTWAYWSAPSKGNAGGEVATLQAPTITSAAGGAESAAIGWSSVTAPGSGAVKYYVRRDGSAPEGNCPAASSPSTATSCTDSGDSPGSHSYTVTAVWRSWTATSAATAVTTLSKPTVASASPSARVQGASNQTITITGSHFLSGAAATFSGGGITVNSTSFKSSTELTANISITSGAATGARSVTVTNPDTGAGTATGIFTVNAAPSVESVSPGSRGQGASEQNLTIKGKNFQNGAAATFSGTGIVVNSTTFKSPTELTANISIEAGASTGSRTVTVTNPDAGTASLSGNFSVSAGPTVTSASPSPRGQGASNQNLTIRGSGFVSGAAASFSGAGIIVNSTSFKSSTELRVNVSIESGASVGLHSVTVTNPDAGAGTLANGFTVNAGPNIESVSPNARAKGTGTQTVTIKGSGFASGAEATFSGSGVTVNSTSFKSSTELTASITINSFASATARTVTVTNTDEGSGSLAGGFTVDAQPNIESLTPSAGDKGGTETVAIKGTGFASGAVATFSGTGVTVNSTTFQSSTELTANITISSSASGTSRTVTVTNTDGGSDSLEGFQVNSAPSVESVSPSSRGQGASNQTIAIKGKNFLNGIGLAVSFSGTGITVNSTNYVNSSEVTANVTIASTATVGLRNVTVTNPDTTSATLANAFTVNAAATLTSASPSGRGQGASKQAIAIKGTGFVTGATASFGPGVTVESTTRNSSTELTATISIEAGASVGLRTITVTNGDGSVASLTNGFTVNAGPNITSPTSASGKVKVAHGGTTEFKVLGSGFVNGATVSISGGFTVNLVTFVGAGELKVKVTAGNGSQTGKYNLTVTNPDGGSATSEGAIENT